MEMTYKLRRHTVILSTHGTVPYNLILSTLKQALDEARKTAPPPDGVPWDLMFDIRGSTATRTADELQGIAMALAQYSDMLSGRLAVLAVDPIRVGAGRTFSAFVSQLGQEPRVFKTPAEAEAYLS
jgi:hypothetical protein